MEDTKNTLDRAKDKGIKTTISYISGIDSLEEVSKGFTLIKDSIVQFPIINIYQIQNAGQSAILDDAACNLEYYIKSRIMLEELFRDKDIEPKRWVNYRPLWYKYYDGKMLDDNSFGQLEKKLIK